VKEEERGEDEDHKRGWAVAESFLIYGESGTYKTTQVGLFADYQVERYDKTDGLYVRLVTSDSTFKPASRQVKSGRLKVWNLKAGPMETKLAQVMLAAQGWWPNVIDEAGVPDLTKGLTKDLTGVVGYAWEGLSQTADLMSQHLTDTQKSTGQPLQSVFEQKLGGQTVSFAHASQGTYGFVQAKTREYVKFLTALPVDRVLVTAHEGKGVDDGPSKKMVFGPAVLGKALTDKASSWFGTTLHHESYMVEDKKRGKVAAVRAYFERHPDPEVGNVFWPAKLDCTPDAGRNVLEYWPEGFIPLVRGKVGYESGLHLLLAVIDSEG